MLVSPNNVSDVISEITNINQSLEGSVWLCDEYQLEIAFSESGSKCYFNYLENGTSFSMTYSRRENILMIEPSNEISQAYLLFNLGVFTLKAEFTSIGTLEMDKKGEIITFKRQ